MDYSLQLMMSLPEVVLAVGAILLMLVAAWGGQAVDQAGQLDRVAVLIGAGIALAGPASAAVRAVGGLYKRRHVRGLLQGADLPAAGDLDPDRAALLFGRPRVTICVPNIRC
jgi:hypothetical protein